jgi:hypothetical protein
VPRINFKACETESDFNRTLEMDNQNCENQTYLDVKNLRKQIP